MFRLRVACVAALTALVSPAVGAPSLNVADNQDGTATVQVVVDATGSLAAEVVVTSDWIMSNPVVGATFDTANPGNNPLTGSVTTGLSESSGAYFVSYGTDVVTAGVYDLLTVDFDFDPQSCNASIDAIGIVAQGGVLGDPLFARFGVSSFSLGDFDNDCDIDTDDFGVFVGEFNLGTVPPAAGLADFDGDRDIDTDDFGVFVNGFLAGNPSRFTPTPEPAMATLLLLATASVGATVRRM